MSLRTFSSSTVRRSRELLAAITAAAEAPSALLARELQDDVEEAFPTASFTESGTNRGPSESSLSVLARTSLSKSSRFFASVAANFVEALDGGRFLVFLLVVAVVLEVWGVEGAGFAMLADVEGYCGCCGRP